MGIVNSLFSNPEFENVQTQVEPESKPKPKSKPRQKSGPGGYGSELTKEELDYWIRNKPVTY